MPTFTAHRIRLLALLLAPLLPLGTACARAIPADVGDEDACRLAVRIVRSDEASPHEAWAFSRITLCGSEGGAALAARMETARAETDTLVLDRLTAPAGHLRDGQMLRAALSIAGDPGATVEARVFAIRTIIRHARPGQVLRFGHLAALDDRHTCVGDGSNVHVEPADGAPLLADWLRSARELGRRLTEQAHEPPAVRRAAACLRTLPE